VWRYKHYDDKKKKYHAVADLQDLAKLAPESHPGTDKRKN